MLDKNFRNQLYTGIYISQILPHKTIESLLTKRAIDVASILGLLKSYKINEMILINGWDIVIEALTEFVEYIAIDTNIIIGYVSKSSICKKSWLSHKNRVSFFKYLTDHFN